jgi:hypothetical protein
MSGSICNGGDLGLLISWRSGIGGGPTNASLTPYWDGASYGIGNPSGSSQTLTVNTNFNYQSPVTGVNLLFSNAGIKTGAAVVLTGGRGTITNLRGTGGSSAAPINMTITGYTTVVDCTVIVVSATRSSEPVPTTDPVKPAENVIRIHIWTRDFNAGDAIANVVISVVSSDFYVCLAISVQN